MSETAQTSRRAERLTRWYPLAWRQRYGAEFTDLLEQEIVETPHDVKRTRNIIYKGLMARLGDLGILRVPISSRNPVRTAVATTYALVSVFTLFALDYWSGAMNLWNEGGIRQSFAITAWLGAATVMAAVLAVAAVVMVAVIIWSAAREVVRSKPPRMTRQLISAVVSAAFVVYAVVPAIRFELSLQGIDWTRPGQIIKLVSGATAEVVVSIYRTWSNQIGWFNLGTWAYLFTPVALVVLSLSVGKLVRQMEFSLRANKVGRVVVVVASVTMVLFPVCYLGWVFAGGPPTVFHSLVSGVEMKPYIFYQGELVVMFVVAGFGVLSTIHGLRREPVITIEA